ncbi:hypothetical protein ACFO4E_15720 [Nocardiopsis mangrovi]|uniref:Knr4/Smi1-like domain-containing protein n=1 Tax=Nocardiopsis mangrovi TaxID=1179818 RepID=A0ABV9DWP4_9ACTN
MVGRRLEGRAPNVAACWDDARRVHTVGGVRPWPPSPRRPSRTGPCFSWSDFGLADDHPELIRLLERSLLIADDNGGGGQYLFLHADSVAENGEWTAYEWWPGDGDDPEPHDGFAALVAGLWDDRVRRGQ